MSTRSSGSSPQLTVHSHTSPTSFFTPTNIRFSDLSSDPSERTPTSEWNSRKARKGRYASRPATVRYITTKDGARGSRLEGYGTMIAQELNGRIKHEESKLKPNLKMDISWWVAVAFTFGSAVWVVNGYVEWFPLFRPNLDNQTVSRTAAALAFIGGTVFEIGSYLMVVEALDRGREINFGTAIGQLLHHRRHVDQEKDAEHHKLIQDHVLHHRERHSSSTTLSHAVNTDGGTEKNGKQSKVKPWIWWGPPMWHDMGYCAAVIQFFGATVFWIATITGLPGVIPGFAAGGGSIAIIDVFFWTPQVVGGTGFIISSTLLMLEVQGSWWRIKPLDIGWHVGFWNLIGSIGFTLCGALGFSSKSGVVYESDLATFWGSWAFLIGSCFQVWESIWREAEPEPDTKKG
ncbi:hypothetical protein BD324DRAFT_634045 [Kockovaella imperatae]|uniref:Integral membrane protein n=1 Tax=Kockovaella imperatae TaxID=4999 RepID=A0A1Y1UCC4_9TREE|nr:hypothetical protein BD324DRAFT_634045 [Kockovaella imperatae]ORX35146.1 hypothetical protein BD324DRAFT_634045 [Kockovaella imperatae]